MKKYLPIFLLCFVTAAFGQLPNTEIWLFKCSAFNGTYSVMEGANVTNLKGYDNQPSFSENGSYMLYTGQRDSVETDIFRYELSTHSTTRITQTAFSEYSPTYMAGNKFISSVVVEKDSVQRLWKYNKVTGEASLILPKVYQVGYHCWYDQYTLFLFQVTEPSSLLICDVKSGVTRTMVSDVGRCMATYRSPAKKFLLYTQEDTSKSWVIKALDGNGMKATDFKPIKLPGQCQDFAIDKNGNILCCDGAIVYQWTIGKSVEWYKVADLSTYGLHKVTRLAISPDGMHIAFVDNL